MSEPAPVAPSFESLHAELRRMARHGLHKGGDAAQISPTTLLHGLLQA